MIIKKNEDFNGDMTYINILDELEQYEKYSKPKLVFDHYEHKINKENDMYCVK